MPGRLRRRVDQGRARIDALDRRWALAVHRGADRPALLRLLAACSLLGDATGWLLLALLLPLADAQHGLQVSRELVLLGLGNTALYALLKQGTRRDRPCQGCAGIAARMAAADRYSFPSGHTLHAVAFAALLSAWYPWAAGPLAVFATLVALSRVALGLHYPSDVLAGAAIGVASAAWLAWLVA
jgi:undecaprenyl-diphosphatase